MVEDTPAKDSQTDQPPLTAGLSDLADLGLRPPPEAPRQDGNRTAKWLIGFVYLALLASNVWLIADARRHAIEQARIANTNLARAVSERVEASIAEVDHILDGVVYELERTDITPEVLTRLQPVFVNHVARGDQIQGLFVYDASGRWIATSEPQWDPAFNDGDKAYFAYHRTNPSALTLVSPPLMSRSAGKWVVPVSRRINDADGHFAGVAVATLDIEHFRRVLQRFDIGEGAITLTIDGRYMVRRPEVTGDGGEPASRLNTVLGDAPSGFGDARSPFDGIVRLFSYERTRDYPVRVVVASSKAEVLGKWWTTSILQTLWVLLLCAALKMGTNYTRRALRSRAMAEARLREAHSALAVMNQRLQQFARLDALTGLPNRGYFDRRLARAFKHAQREQVSLAIAMVDVDAFKQYNDTYGHVEGDACLVRIGAALRTVARRPEDFVARYGGEEMVLLLPHTDAAGAAQLAEMARRAVSELAIPHAGSHEGHVTISLGVAAAVPGRAESPKELLKQADAALYEAKRRGRNRVQLASGQP